MLLYQKWLVPGLMHFPMLEDDHWKPDIERALKKCHLEQCQAHVGKLSQYAHRFKGRLRESFQEIIDFAKRNGILVVHDNPYSLILNEEKPISLLSVPGAKEVALELNSLSKSHNMAGWRIGWISGAKEYIDAIIQIKSNVDSGMFKPLQLAAVKALSNPDSWHRGTQ